MNCTTACAGAEQKVTAESIEAMVRAIEALPPEPIGEFMRQQGMPPERGYILILPEAMRETAGPLPPRYVRFSSLIAKPVIGPDLAARMVPGVAPADNA